MCNEEINDEGGGAVREVALEVAERGEGAARENSEVG